MTVKESVDSYSDLSVAIPADANRSLDDEAYSKKKSKDVRKIGILDEKFKTSQTSLIHLENSSDIKRLSAHGEKDNAKVVDNDEHSPPDGGLRAWMIMLGSFMINGILFSVINTYSLIYIELQKKLEEAGETEASSKAGEFFFLDKS